ncbi:MAG: response regulator transcription factor [Cytophagales bacterium]|nr:response regulator transcription factor [Cytophagales bacterium]MDW8384186.1 response regulator transcription factor [Flammeovirgaceae bacterium]
MKKIKILLADDHRLFREGIRLILSRITDFEVIGEVTDGKALLDFLHHQQPEVVLVDISMPFLGGLDAMTEIKKMFPFVKFIVLTMHEDGDYIVKSIHLGADGYLFKNVEPYELEKAIRLVAKGEKYFNAEVSHLFIQNLSRKNYQENQLTKREIEILKLVSAGYSTKQIADQLHISHRTVDTHRVNMMRKLEAVNTAELIRKAIEKKLIP